MQAKKINVRYLKGVGPKRSEILQKLSINTIYDLLYYLPRRYEDRSRLKSIKELKIGEHQTLRGKILTLGAYRTKKGTSVFQMAVGDKTGVIYCVWFNQMFLKKTFTIDQELIIYGKVEKYDKLQINHPEYEIVKPETKLEESVNMGRIVPVYSLTQDLSQRHLRFLTHGAIEKFLASLQESIPAGIVARKSLAGISFAIQNIHFPTSFENLEKAYKRLVFEEFFMLQLAFALKKKNLKVDTSGIEHRLDENTLVSFKKLFSFEFTPSQLKAIGDITQDMASSVPMNRLLEGDVGSGKTLVAIYGLLLTVKNGYQAAFMAPTEILARQHYINISELLMPLGVNVGFLASGLNSVKKERLKNEIKNGTCDIVIGTHALIWEGVDFNKLGFVVIDEQHKFGVNQRRLLQNKGARPDLLIMTATPIPRTLALSLYGDLDISVIRELPRGRCPITTCWMDEDKREDVYRFIREEIKKGRQAYIVYPYVGQVQNGSSKSGIMSKPEKAAIYMYNKLQKEIFPGLSLGLMHGKMKSKEKESIMKKFSSGGNCKRSGKIDILVSTTVVEVGIDVANATVMVIEHAEHFGLSQLHQLRGRIGRGTHPSYCILLGDPKTESAEKRFHTMSRTTDGFKVAEEDLELRGPGEFFGTKQHGLPEIRFGNIVKDLDIMEEARDEAFELIKKDPALKGATNSLIKQALKQRFVVAS